MPLYRSFLSAVALFSSGFALTAAHTARAGDAAPTGPAVVELFTSEGCSSCPPADENLANILDDARRHGRAVYPLAWHVDYWNHLGWADRFSSAEASRRQERYVTALHLDTAYTPQMVVNGSAEFVGSDVDRSHREIDAALHAPAVAQVTLDRVEEKDQQIDVTYSTRNAPAGSVLVVAAVERGLSSVVGRGENGGRTLTHENVVRAFTQIDPAKADHGNATLHLPADAKPANLSVIAFVQSTTTMKILGAAAADVAVGAAAR